MVDHNGEDLPRLVEVPIDLGPIFGLLLDLVEIAVVRNQRIIGLFIGPLRTHSDRVVLWRQIGRVDFPDPTIWSGTRHYPILCPTARDAWPPPLPDEVREELIVRVLARSDTWLKPPTS